MSAREVVDDLSTHIDRPEQRRPAGLSRSAISWLVIVFLVLSIFLAVVFDTAFASRFSASYAQPPSVVIGHELSELQQTVEFSRMEHALTPLIDYPSGELGVGSDLASTLSRAVEPFAGGEVALETVERLQFLIGKLIPGINGREVSRIFPVFLSYQRQKRVLEYDYSLTAGTLSDNLELFSALQALRGSVFGEQLASILFADRERLRGHLLARRALVENGQLSEDQRLAGVQALNRRFRIASSSGSGADYRFSVQ